MHVHHVGMLRSWASWSKVMRHHLLALQEQGHDVSSRVISEDDRYDPEFPLPVPLRSLPERPPPDADDVVTITYLPPTEYDLIDVDSPLVGFLAYEATRWPPEWVQEAKERLALAVVASTFNRRGLVDSGFPEERVAIVPHGYEPSRYRPPETELSDDGPFELLFLGTPSRRKGLDIVIRAVSEAFEPEDDVRVVLKVNPYDDPLLEWTYVISDWRERCARLREAGYRVETIFEPVSETEVVDLFQSADLFCLPTRGEGYGNTVFEAMACGCPPVVTEWGGHVDYVDETNALPISEFDLVPADERFLGHPPPASTGARMADPDPSAVASALSWAYDHPRELARLGRNARESVEHLTWAETTRQLLAVLSDLD